MFGGYDLDFLIGARLWEAAGMDISRRGSLFLNTDDEFTNDMVESVLWM